jgi:hypothetical protein
MLILETSRYWDTLTREVSKGPDEVLLATYGLWTGIKGGRLAYPNGAANFLTNCPKGNCNEIRTRAIIGLPMFIQCKPGCPECIANEEKYRARIDEHINYWHNFSWKVVDEFHLKAVLFRHGTKWSGWGGGRNLSGSKWVDVSVKLSATDAKQLADAFLIMWKDPESLVEGDGNDPC